MVEKAAHYAFFARQVDRAMKRAGIGVGDVAKALRVTPEMARRYREGLAMPRQDKLKQLAALLGMTPAELQYGEIDPAAAAPGLLAGLARLSAEEITLIEHYRGMPDYAKKALRARAAELLESFGKVSKKNPFGQGGTQ